MRANEFLFSRININKFACVLTLAILASGHVKAGLSNKFKIYFNQAVDTSVSSGTPAIYLNGTIMDTLIAYINNAKYTIDVAQYDYTQSSYFSNIATAIDSAYARGVRVRWIYDGSSYNDGLSGLNGNIPTLASPTSNNYGIMHNKFVIIDANAPDSTIAWVNTSSLDWSATMIDYDYNNSVFIQSRQLAQAYTAQFNQMWGDTGALPDTITSKFGPYKSDLGPHTFMIDSIQVDLYFSPTDGVNSQVLNSIATADSQLFFGVYCLTQSNDAQAIISKYNAGVTTYGILDQYSAQASGGQYNTLSAALGGHLKEYVQNSSIYHNKFMFVDPCSPSSDPQVLTGSYNWTKSADEYNDENIIIMHDATIANLYYQEFYANFTSLSGSITACENPAGINEVGEINISVYPNPSQSYWTLDVPANWIGAQFRLCGISGEIIARGNVDSTQNLLNNNLPAGIYLVKVEKDGQSVVRKAVKI